jgi:hypothetical protein
MTYYGKVRFPDFRNRWHMGLGGFVTCLAAGAVSFVGGPQADDAAFTAWLIGVVLQGAIIWEGYGPASRRGRGG